MDVCTEVANLRRRYQAAERRKAKAQASIDASFAELNESGFSDDDIEVLLSRMTSAAPASTKPTDTEKTDDTAGPGATETSKSSEATVGSASRKSDTMETVCKAHNGCDAVDETSDQVSVCGSHSDVASNATIDSTDMRDLCEAYLMVTAKHQHIGDDYGHGTDEQREYMRSIGITTEEEKAASDQWRAAEAWKDFMDLNRAFLRGESRLTPYHLGPIYEETNDLVPTLIRLHDYGILTFQSQPAMNRGPYEHSCPCCDDVLVAKEQQRSFVSLALPQNSHAIPRDTLSNFLVELMINDNFYTSVLTFNGHCKFGNCHRDQRLLSNFPKGSITHYAEVVSSNSRFYR